VRVANSSEETKKMKTVKIKGMSCQHCVKSVTKALSEIAGITDVQVDLERGEATFEEVQPVAQELLRESIKKAGFELG
jgi:copper chaperone